MIYDDKKSLDKMPIVPLDGNMLIVVFFSETNLRYSFLILMDKLFHTDDHPVDLYNLMVLPKVIPFCRINFRRIPFYFMLLLLALALRSLGSI